jgi:hypothetical protein
MAQIQRAQRKVEDKLTTGVPTMPNIQVDNSKAIIAEAGSKLLSTIANRLIDNQNTKNIVDSEALYTKFLTEASKIDTTLKQQYSSDPDTFQTAHTEALNTLRDNMSLGIQNNEVRSVFDNNTNNAIMKANVGAFDWSMRQRGILNTENMVNTFSAKSDLVASSDNIQDFYSHLVETKQYYDALKMADNTMDKQHIETAYNTSRKEGVNNFFYKIADSDEATIKETIQELDRGEYSPVLDEKEIFQKKNLLNNQLEQLKNKREYIDGSIVSGSLRSLLDTMHNKPEDLTTEKVNRVVENLTLTGRYKGSNVKVIDILQDFIRNRDKTEIIKFPKQTNSEAYTDIWNTYQIISRNIKKGIYDPEDLSYYLSKVEDHQKKGTLSKSDYSSLRKDGYDYLVSTVDKIYGLERGDNGEVSKINSTPYTRYLKTGIAGSAVKEGPVSDTVLDFMQDIDTIVNKFYPSSTPETSTQKKGAILTDYLKETAKYNKLSTQLALGQSKLASLNPQSIDVNKIVFNNVLKNANVSKEQAVKTVFVDKEGRKFKFIANEKGEIIDFQGL